MNRQFEDRGLGRKKLPVEKLKQCPLCGSLNARKNENCFVCGWHGQFDTDQEMLSLALQEMVEQCPGIVEILGQSPEQRKGLLQRMLKILKRQKDDFDIAA